MVFEAPGLPRHGRRQGGDKSNMFAFIYMHLHVILTNGNVYQNIWMVRELLIFSAISMRDKTVIISYSISKFHKRKNVSYPLNIYVITKRQF